jgi:hypothetical protein
MYAANFCSLVSIFLSLISGWLPGKNNKLVKNTPLQIRCRN